MSEEQDKIDVKGTEEEKGAQETASDKVDKSGEGTTPPSFISTPN